ncbi:MAG: GNAT family N-acetyltransferase [archaeon]
MEFIHIRSVDAQEFKAAWTIYLSSFPSDERRTLAAQKTVFDNTAYHFFVVCEDDRVVAVLTTWTFKKFFFVEHLAVARGFRGKGLGTKVISSYLAHKRKKVVLEVELPKTELAMKRIRFYTKRGFVPNAFAYIQPSYGKDKDPVPMFLMTYPEKINGSEFSSIREKLHTIVYGLDQSLLQMR